MTFAGPGRGGVVYIGVLIVGVVVLIGAFAYHATMRHGRMSAYRSMHAEYARLLARAGMDLARSHLTAAVADPASKIYEGLAKPVEDYMSAGRDPQRLGDPIDLHTMYPQLMADLAAALPRGHESVDELSARFYLLPEYVSPLPAMKLADKGIDRTGREKKGRIYVEVVAEISTSPVLKNIEGRATGYFEFRAVHAPVPVLSDFSLMLLGGPKGPPINSLEADHQGLINTSTYPLVLSNGQAGKQFEIARQLTPEFFKSQGWVYLGATPQILNLSYSQEESDSQNQVGEDFHFYQLHSDPNLGAQGRVVKADAQTITEANAHLTGGNRDFWEVRNWDMGVHTLAEGPLKDEYQKVFKETPAEERKGSLLKLLGVTPYRVSPTLVFGDVKAGFFRISAATPKNQAQGSFDSYFTILVDEGQTSGFLAGMKAQLMPFIGKLIYLFEPWYSGKYAYYDPDVIGSLLPDDRAVQEDQYKRLQSGRKTRQYNQALLFLAGENQDPNPIARAERLGFDKALFQGSNADVLFRLPGVLFPDRWTAALEGLDLRAIDPAATMATLKGATCWTPRDTGEGAEVLKRLGFLNGSRLDLGSTVDLVGDLTLPPLTEVTRGGILRAKSITLQGAVPAALKGTLVLIASEGNITLPADQKIAASLVALSGQVVPQGQVELAGNIVAKNLDLSGISTGRSPSLLNYPPALKSRSFDTTPPENLVIDFSRRYVGVD